MLHKLLFLLLGVPAHTLVLGLGSVPRAAKVAVSPHRMLFGGGGKQEGAGGGMNMLETIQKAQQVGEKLKKLQEELAKTEARHS